MSFSLQANEAEAGLKEIFEYMETSGRRCYIAIDEFQQITDYPEKGTEALLRSHIQFSPNVHFVFAGSKKHIMDAMFSSVNRPFYQSTQKLGLKEIPCETYCEQYDKIHCIFCVSCFIVLFMKCTTFAEFLDVMMVW